MTVALTQAQLDTQPVIIGTGQVSAPHDAWPDIRSPLDLMAEAAQEALADAGGGIAAALDSITVVRVFSWDHGNAPRMLAARLGALDPAERGDLLDLARSDSLFAGRAEEL